MGFHTTDIHLAAVRPVEAGLVLVAQTGHAGKVLQCYVGGQLADWQRPRGGDATFFLPHASGREPILLLAVDSGEERVNYWPAALAAAERHGNRLRVRFRLDLLDGRRPTDVWRIWRGEPTDGQAQRLVHQAEVHPGGRGATGWGFVWGRGGWGYSGANSPGWGRHWGHTWGYGIDYLTWVSPPLPRGAYPLRVEVADAAGNLSAAWEMTVVVDTYSRPASGLAVQSYDRTADKLILALAPSEDLA